MFKWSISSLDDSVSFLNFFLKKVIAKLFLQQGGQLVPFYPWKISNQLGETSGALKCVLRVLESERRFFYISDVAILGAVFP